jgi:hypothetical protein
MWRSGLKNGLVVDIFSKCPVNKESCFASLKKEVRMNILEPCSVGTQVYLSFPLVVLPFLNR